MPWLRSTKCVQSADDEIRRKAIELAKKSKDLELYIRNVIQFTSKNRGSKKSIKSLDAKTALHAGGSCTSRANLAAALLRAMQIPARTVSHLPSWFRQYFFEHWLVEYWHPGVGWIWIESTMNQFRPPSNEVVVLAVSSSEDEDQCDDPLHLRYIMPGAAYLSGCELSKELCAARNVKKWTAMNIAAPSQTSRPTHFLSREFLTGQREIFCFFDITKFSEHNLRSTFTSGHQRGAKTCPRGKL